jgi:hypothetical protein
MTVFKNLKKRFIFKLKDIIDKALDINQATLELGGYDCPKNSERFYSTTNVKDDQIKPSTAVLYSGFNLENKKISIAWIPSLGSSFVNVYTYSPNKDGNFYYPDAGKLTPACEFWADFKQSIDNGNWGKFASDNFTHNLYMKKYKKTFVRNAYDRRFTRVLKDLSQN